MNTTQTDVLGRVKIPAAQAAKPQRGFLSD
jgi:hypothetical protein